MQLQETDIVVIAPTGAEWLGMVEHLRDPCDADVGNVAAISTLAGR